MPIIARALSSTFLILIFKMPWLFHQTCYLEKLHNDCDLGNETVIGTHIANNSFVKASTIIKDREITFEMQKTMQYPPSYMAGRAG